MFAFTFKKAIEKPRKGSNFFDELPVGTVFYINGNKHVKRSARTAFAYVYNKKKASRRSIKLSQRVEAV